MNKKGFTLVELLAVIAILAILIILAMPNIVELLNRARKNAFLVEARTIYNESESKYVMEQFSGYSISKISSSNEKTALDLTNKNLDYCVILDNEGKVSKFAAGNNRFHIILNSVESIQDLDINKVEDNKLDNIICTKDTIKIRKKCTYDGELVAGVEYTTDDDPYIYRYKQHYVTDHWENLSALDTGGGWGVRLKNTDSTDPIEGELCAEISGKPIVSMTDMFRGSQTSSINLESFDTSKVKNMQGMFFGCNNLSELDLSSFDTSKVTSMLTMFAYNYSLEHIDLSSFDTSNVKIMNAMFYSCNSLKNLNLSNFNTSNVTDMHQMFYGCENLTELDLSDFNTSKITNTSNMFRNCKKLSKLNLSSFNTSNVTDMHSMFAGCKNLTELDLSNFNTSKVTNTCNMFDGCSSLVNVDLRNANFSSIIISNEDILTQDLDKYLVADEIEEKENDISGSINMFARIPNTVKVILKNQDTYNSLKHTKLNENNVEYIE